MGQKSNLRSFNKSDYRLNFQNSFKGSSEYFYLFKDAYYIKHYIRKLFERNRCFVQQCDIILNSSTSKIIVFISFLSVKPLQKKNLKNKMNNKIQIFKQNAILQRLKKIFNDYGYNLPLVFVLKNLTPEVKKKFKENKQFLTKRFGRFRKQPFFRSGILVYLLLNNQKGTSSVLASFVSRFMKLLHRSKKINIFFQFIREFVRRSDNVNGLKIKIKGRFRKASRSRSRVFEKGSLPLQTIKADLSYQSRHIFTSYGVFGLKVWIYY